MRPFLNLLRNAINVPQISDAAPIAATAMAFFLFRKRGKNVADFVF